MHSDAWNENGRQIRIHDTSPILSCSVIVVVPFLIEE